MVVYSYSSCSFFFFEVHGDHRDLHELTHSFPTRRSSDLEPAAEDASASKQQNKRHKVSPTDEDAPALDTESPDMTRPDACPAAPKMVTTITLPDSPGRSEEHTSELQSLMRISYAGFCLKKKKYV